MNNELIKINTDDNGQQAVSGRELHRFLDSKERFSKWFDRMVGEYGFVEGTDYTPYQMVHPQNNQIYTDYAMTIDMAKEASMVSKLPRGREARQYFIECERRLKAAAIPLDSYMIDDYRARAMRWLEEQDAHHREIAQRDETIAVLEPKAELADRLLGIDTDCSIGEAAQTLGYRGYDRNNLFRLLRQKHVIIDNKHVYQQYIDKGYFRVVTRSYYNEYAQEDRLDFQIRVTPAGMDFLDRLIRRDIDNQETLTLTD